MRILKPSQSGTVLTWLLAFCFALELHAAPSTFFREGRPYTIDTWETDDGLPQSSVIAMTQTQDGYLWLGTLNGLVRFDGLRFTVFDEFTTPGLLSSRIISLFEDAQTNLWVGTETAGVHLIRDGHVTQIDIGRGSREGRLLSACQDTNGAVWLYTADGRIGRYREGVLKLWPLGPERQSQNRSLIAEDSGLIWAASPWRLFAIQASGTNVAGSVIEETFVPEARLDLLLASRSGGHWRLVSSRIQKWRANELEKDLGPYPWTNATVSAACEDLQGNLLVGTLGAGLFWFNTNGTATCISTNQGLSHNYILSLHVDREASLWVGTDGGGLNRIKLQSLETLDPTRGLVVQSVAENPDGSLWIATNAKGLYVWNHETLARLGPSYGLLNSDLRSVFVDQESRLWVGTWGSGLVQFLNERFQRPEGSPFTPVVLAIHQDRSGRLWVGTQDGLVRYENGTWRVFTTQDGLSVNTVRAIADDAKGNLWIGTVGGGLHRYQEGRIAPVLHPEASPTDDISSLFVDASGALWVGTVGRGLARIEGDRCTRYTTREGLVSNSISYLIEDDTQNLWIGSNAGLMRVPMADLVAVAQGRARQVSCRSYGKADGLPTRECTLGSQPGPCRTRGGRLWFPTVKGLVSIDPAQLQPNRIPPPISIEAIYLDGQLVNTNRVHAHTIPPVTIPAAKERLEIHYTSLNLANPAKARFRYRLEHHEKEWTEAGDSRVARYSRLPAGNYRFQLAAANEDNVWNEANSGFSFVVLPPFYLTWWFLCASAVTLLGAVVATVHYFSTQKLQRQVLLLRHKEALEKDRARIARDIHDQVGASLTQLSLLGELVEADKEIPREIEEHARQICQTARTTTHALDEIVWTVNPSNDTLDGLVNYLCKYAQDYLAVANLRYRLEVPSDLPALAVSPDVRHNVFLAGKEAITNVVRHAKASSVFVRLRLSDTQFTFEIEDDGRGIASLDPKAARTRNGLSNMRKRMEEVGGSFAMEPASPSGQGTIVRLTAPLAPGLAPTDRPTP